MPQLFSTTLSFYLARRYLSIVFITTIILACFVLMLDFVEMLRRISGYPTVTGLQAFQMSLLKLPDLLLQITPFAVLLGTLAAFSRLSRNHELTAIRATGMPARQFLVPPLVVCMCIGFFNLGVLNPISAAMLKTYERQDAEIFPGSTRGLVVEGGQIWLRQNEENRDILIYAEEVAESGRVLEDVSMFIFNKDGSFRERLDAEHAELMPGWWQLKQVINLKPQEKSVRYVRMRLATELDASMIRNSFTSPNTIPFWELRGFVRLLQESGFPSQKHELHLQKLYAMPALIMAMFLLAAPFALHFSRSRGMGSMLLLGLCFGFMFHFFTDLVGTFGLAGRLNLVIAAWLPTIVAALTGFALLLHFREE